MSDLKATEFEEILGGDFDTPCYVDKEESFKHAIAVGRPIVVLFGDSAVKQMKKFIEVGKEKQIVQIYSKAISVMKKADTVILFVNIATNAPIGVIKAGVDIVLQDVIFKYVVDNIEKFKEYNILLDEKEDRVIFISKKVEKDKHTEIIEKIYTDFVSTTTELIDKYDNIFKVTDIYTVLGKGTVLGGKVLKGTFSLNEEVKVVDGRLTELAIERIVNIEQFRKLIDSVSVGEECGLLINRKDDFKQEIEKHRLLLNDIYVVENV